MGHFETHAHFEHFQRLLVGKLFDGARALWPAATSRSATSTSQRHPTFPPWCFRVTATVVAGYGTRNACHSCATAASGQTLPRHLAAVPLKRPRQSSAIGAVEGQQLRSTNLRVGTAILSDRSGSFSIRNPERTRYNSRIMERMASDRALLQCVRRIFLITANVCQKHDPTRE